MTEQILKKVAKLEASVLKTLETRAYNPNTSITDNQIVVAITSLGALRVAVNGLDEIESLAKIETRAIQLRIWNMQEQIATILGVKEGEK